MRNDYWSYREECILKRILCAVLLALFLVSNAMAENRFGEYEEMLTGTWVTMTSEWNLNNLPGTFSYPSDRILMTYSPSGTAFIHFYYVNDDEIDRTERAYTYELSFGMTGTVIAINDAYGTAIIYEKTEPGSLAGGNWYADYFINEYQKEPYNPGHKNLYGIRLSFNNDGTANLILITQNPRYEGYNEEEISATWSLEENEIIVQSDAEGFEMMQGTFDGSTIDFSGSVSDLYFYRN